MDTKSNSQSDKKIVKPATIFKYEAFSAQSLKNLKAQSIYFGSPLGFNDPYDCALKPRVSASTLEELEALRNIYAQKYDVPIDFQTKFKTVSTVELGRMLESSALTVLEKNVDSFLKTKGVSCFSEVNNDLLMWSHYGGRYKGFCLEFDTEFEPFRKMRKVKYSENMPKFNVISAFTEDNYDGIFDLFCTKSKSWEYEKEWRILHEEAGTLFTYKPDVLKSVYFGPDIDNNSLEIVCLILQGQNSKVNFWRGKRSEEKFEVIFEKINYINHLEAKSKGLL